MEIQGRVKKLMGVTEGVSSIGNPYRRLEFIFEFFGKPSDTFADTLIFTVLNDKIEEYALVEGEEIVIDISTKVKMYNGRMYNDIWLRDIKKEVKPEPVAEQQGARQRPTAEQQSAMEKLKQMGEQAATGDEDGSKDDGLPF